MAKIPLGLSSYKRDVADAPEVSLRNRYFESNPTNFDDQVALLARPGLNKWLTVGSGPIRAVYSQPGAFDEALFVVSGTDLYRIDQDETTTFIGDIGATGFVSMAATDDPYLFVATGSALYVYTDTGFAAGTLTSTGAIVTTERVVIGTTYYAWTSGSVDTGSPLGSNAAPWLVALGADDEESLANMLDAINDSGTPGTTYSTALVPHSSVQATSSTATTLNVRARASGAGGNAIATTETGANIAWGGATLSGGGSAGITQVVTPDNVGIVSVGYIASFVICVVAEGFGFNGRFYWIDPFETIIDPLNFATAERAPDPLWSVNVIGDQFWLPGTNTNEVWYPTGDELIPFLKVQARVFDRGVWEGTAVLVKDTVVLVDYAGDVYAIGGEPIKISTNAVSEQIRLAMNQQIQNP